MLKEYQKEGGLIIIVKDTHDKKATEFKRFGNTTHCLKGTREAELVDELKPFENLENVITVEKNSTSFMEAPKFRKVMEEATNIKRFDVVSLEYKGSKYLIKRVIGLPGELVEYKNNTLYIDGERMGENFLDDETITKNFSIKELGYEKIPEDMYLVLGDNREDSLDSREIGLIKKDTIIGKVSFRIWPINKFGFTK